MVTVSSTGPNNECPVDTPRTIIPSPSELKANAYESSNLQAALEALYQDGFCVLKSVVDVAHVDKLNSFMSKEADELVRNKTKAFNQGVDCALSRPPSP